MPSASDIRQQFIDYFRERHGHAAVNSSPVVPHDDPTLLFTNAGMNQFKDVFLGTGKRDYTRAVDSQKCIRAGGKHNDLEDVGKDTYHHTFFEMLGNWSFGDYFKKEAIAWAWDLLTNVWGLEKDRLHVTVFAGDPADGIARDQEAADLWRNETDVPRDHIHFGDKKDNFWEMGETGPCGPSSEIHIDLTPDKTGGDLVNQDDPRVIEIWNLVFIQFNRSAGGKLTELPARHVDTGMGFERICAVLEGKNSNYDTDVFAPIFKAIQQITRARPYRTDSTDAVDVAYRVLADHIRCLTVALTDGAVPGNEGRGYVLRRILRRAVRHGRQTLDQHEPFFYKLVPSVVDSLGEAYPELAENAERVQGIIREEEESFGRTLDRGIALFEQAAERGGDRLSGEDAFKLYDTYGFPLDLTQVMAEERGLAVDVKGFEKRMDEARKRSRAGAAGGDARQSLIEIVQQQDLPETDFLGYKQTEAHVTTTCRLFMADGEGYSATSSLTTGVPGAVVTDQTPFYAEAGGQVGDWGTIKTDRGTFQVHDTIKFGGTWFHLGEVESGELTAGEQPVTLSVESTRRRRIMANHTVTHLLNLALRDVLGDHVLQRGSLVDEEKTRFDFSHDHALSLEEIEAVEKHVASRIDADLPVCDEVAPQETALEIESLRAVFGEKYPPHVRVLSIGPGVQEVLENPRSEAWREYSIEFCGGTHVPNTGVIEDFALVSEEAVARGIRRLVGVTGQAAREARQDAQRILSELDGLTQSQSEAQRRDRQDVSDLIQQIGGTTLPLVERAKIDDRVAEIQRQLKEVEKERAREAAASIVDDAREVAENADGEVITARFEGADGGALRKAMDVIRKKQPEAALLLAGVGEDKVALVASVPEAKIARGLKAGDWVREVAQVVGGGGGGRPDMAQAGGKDPSKVDEALATAQQFARGKL
ncbi:MAG: alanine--tRNA ligase [Phycisphaeraceae bacterium]